METASLRPVWASRSWPLGLLAAACVVLGLFYFGMCLLGLKLAIIHPSITTVWPGTGVALAAFLVLGYRVWPGIFLGAFLVNFATASAAGPGILGCLGIAGGNTLEGLFGAFLVNRFADGCHTFERPRHVFRFVFLAALLSPIVSASCGVACLQTPWQEIGLRWGTWWLGDAVGALIVAPPLILWSIRPSVRDSSPRNLLHAAAVVLALVLVSLLVFADWLIPHVELKFVFLPLIIWVAYHFGSRGIATISLVVAVVAVIGMQPSHASPSFTLDEQSMVHYRAQLLLQAFLGLTAATGLGLAAVVAERDRSDADLREAREKLERRVQERTADLARSNDALRHENMERQQAEQKFRDLLESAPDAMVIVNSHGTIVLVNAQAEKMFGYARGEMLGNPVELLVPQQLTAQHQQHRQHYFLEPGVRPMGVGRQLHGRRKDGHEFPVEISLSPLKTEEGILVSSAIRDISTRQETEAKLRQAERLAAIGEMIAGLAHESRNALQQSQACLELLALKVEGWPDIAQLVMDVQKAQDHLHYLYEEVRGYAAPIKLRPERIDLGVLLGAAWDVLEHARHGRQANLVQEAPAPNLACSADAQAMRHALRNLLENSLHACPDPVEIRARWEDAVLRGQPALRLSLADNGPGLSAEAHKRIFQPFFTTKIQGTGLGLAITRRIVEAHGGVIAVSANHKPGMEVQITLPRCGV